MSFESESNKRGEDVRRRITDHITEVEVAHEHESS
jgi:hypothetical protein